MPCFYGVLPLPIGDVGVAWLGQEPVALCALAAYFGACTIVEERLCGSVTPLAFFIRALALGARSIVLMLRQDEAGAMEAFRAAFAEHPVGNELSMRAMTRLTLNLIAVGATERNLAEVLTSDRDKSASVAPLIAALWERCGEPVRVPGEVLAVAKDICKQIEDRVDRGILTAF